MFVCVCVWLGEWEYVLYLSKIDEFKRLISNKYDSIEMFGATTEKHQYRYGWMHSMRINCLERNMKSFQSSHHQFWIETSVIFFAHLQAVLIDWSKLIQIAIVCLTSMVNLLSLSLSSSTLLSKYFYTTFFRRHLIIVGIEFWSRHYFNLFIIIFQKQSKLFSLWSSWFIFTIHFSPHLKIAKVIQNRLLWSSQHFRMVLKRLIS